MAPAIAPLIGVWLAEAFGWRSLPALLALMGAITLVAATLLLSETNATTSRTLKPADYARLLRTRGFVVTIVAGALTTSSLFSLLATTPFIVVEQLGGTLPEVGVYYFLYIAGILAGSLLSNRLVRPVGFRNLITASTLLGAITSTIMLATVAAGGLTSTSFVVLGFVYCVVPGLMGPLALTTAVGMTDNLKGAASGLYGFSQMSVGAICVVLAGAGADTALSLAAVLCFCGVTGFAMFLWSRLRLRA